MTEQRATIALSEAANAVVNELVDRFGFKERADAAKLGLAWAVRHNLPVEVQRGAGGTVGSTWGTGGSFDGDRRLRELVSAAYPGWTDDPYIALEALMNAGLVSLGGELRARQVSLAELVGLDDPP